MFCQNCGTANADNGRFCINCGVPLAPAGSPREPSDRQSKGYRLTNPTGIERESAGEPHLRDFLFRVSVRDCCDRPGAPFAIGNRKISRPFGRPGHCRRWFNARIPPSGGDSVRFNLAAIAIPNLLRARMAANDASTVGALRRINAAESWYASKYKKGCSASLDALAEEDDDQDLNCEHAG